SIAALALLVVSGSHGRAVSGSPTAAVALAAAAGGRRAGQGGRVTAAAIRPLVEAVLVPPSLAVEVTVKVKVPSCAESAVTVRARSDERRVAKADRLLGTVFQPYLRTNLDGTQAMVLQRVLSLALLLV